MGDLISRDEAYNVVHRYGCSMCAQKILDIPTMNAVPTEHGQWQEHRTKVRGYDKVWYQHCTPQLFESPYYYCPTCGAKMDEKGV